MKIDVVQKEKNGKVIFKINKTSNSFVNMIRREIVESVPTMAIEDVEFRENDSILYDEMLAHRLGLIPFITDLKSYVIPEKCKCNGEGCARCQLKMTLSVKGPGTIYAKDIKTKDPKIKAVYPDMIIVKLTKNQKIEFEATAILGKGKDHIKFTPGLAYYHNFVEFKQNKDLDNAQEIVNKCPKGVFKASGKKIIPLDETKSDMWDTCLNFVPEGTIEIIEEKNKILFTLESWGQLKCKEILTQACNVFIETLDEFEKIM